MSHLQNTKYWEYMNEQKQEREYKRNQLITNIMSWLFIFGFCVLLAHQFVNAL